MKEMDLFGAGSADANIEKAKKNWRELEFVKDQTPEICLAAVNKCGLALKYVKEQTPEICLAAAKQNWKAFRFVKQEILDEFENLIHTKEG